MLFQSALNKEYNSYLGNWEGIQETKKGFTLEKFNKNEMKCVIVRNSLYLVYHKNCLWLSKFLYSLSIATGLLMPLALLSCNTISISVNLCNKIEVQKRRQSCGGSQ